ncbi:MAG TPA: bacteriohemerythrin [Bacteroidetes bacterium]|nr:bacteriohemerythrin [Bacteroidota bacterium]
MQRGSLKIEWDESLMTGNRIIDLQHKYLIDIINELAEAIEAGTAGSVISKIINLLKYYTLWHFEREEQCMERYKCPMAEQNKSAHGKFIETFESFQEEYRQSGGTEDIAMRMYTELTDWLVKHIKKIDMGIEPCIHSYESSKNGND